MKRILLISPIPTHPQIAGNRTRIARLLTSLREMGHDVHFLCVNTEPWKADEQAMAGWWGEHFYPVAYAYPRRSLSRYAGRLRFLFKRGFRELLPLDYRYDDTLDSVLADLQQTVKFDIVIVEYIFWSKALESFDDGVLKVIDTHDVFTERQLLYYEARQPYGWYCTTSGEEAKALNRADVIIAIQEQEKEYFSTLTDKNIVTVGHIAPLTAPTGEQNRRNRILFVGSDAGTNIHGLTMFIHEVLPQIRAANPGLNLLVAGRICQKIDDANGCEKLGDVDDLGTLYKSADVVINPIQFSTGLSIKTIEAMGYSRPVVTTPAGAKGLEDGAGKAFLVARDAAEFSHAVISIMNDAGLSHRLSSSAYQYVRQWNANCLRELEALVDGKRMKHPMAQV